MIKRVIRPTERGQVTIPKSIRQALNISSETPLTIRQENTRIIIEPLDGFTVLAERLQQEVKEKNISQEDLNVELERVRLELFTKLYGSPK